MCHLNSSVQSGMYVLVDERGICVPGRENESSDGMHAGMVPGARSLQHAL